MTVPALPASVHAAFLDSVSRCGGREFIHIPAPACKSYHDGTISLTYGAAREQIDSLQAAYSAAGYGAGHRVAVMLQNRVPFFLHWIALNGLGVCVVPLNDEMAPEEQAYIANHSEVDLVIHLEALQERIAALHPLLEHDPPTVAVERIEQLSPAAAPPADRLTEPGLSAPCALLYTSGSTGKPKGCILSNEYFLLSGLRYIELGGLCNVEQGSERLITPLPLVHMNAMACSTMAMMMSGGCVVQLDRFHPRSWWQCVRESRATIVHYLGVMPAMLLNLDPAQDDFSGQVKFGFGAGVNPRHHAVFEQRFGFPLIEAWAMTETGNSGAVVANREPRHVGRSCFGVPPDHIEYRLVDEQGQDVPAGEAGELLLRHRGERPDNGFFSGYLKNPDATAEAWAGGWFHTGDVIRQESDGSMYFVDRRKNVIRRSGENISALEVEAALSGDDAISLVVLCPVPDEIRGDEVMACIVPAAGAERTAETAERIVNRALQTLVYFKVPGYIGFFDQLPLTASEKPRRADIKALAAASVQRGDCFDTRHLKKRPRSGS